LRLPAYSASAKVICFIIEKLGDWCPGILPNQEVFFRISLERSVSPNAFWASETDVWRIERDDPQKLSSLLEQVGFSITIYPDKTMAIAGGKAVWKYKGKDKSSNRFVLDNGHRLYMIARDDYCDTGVERLSDDPLLEILEGQ
ncbi:hypothetical protein ACNPOL_26390, partial [Pseudomonas shirazica]